MRYSRSELGPQCVVDLRYMRVFFYFPLSLSLVIFHPLGKLSEVLFSPFEVSLISNVVSTCSNRRMLSPQKELTSVRYLVTHPARWFNSLISDRISHMPLLIHHFGAIKRQ